MMTNDELLEQFRKKCEALRNEAAAEVLERAGNVVSMGQAQYVRDGVQATTWTLTAWLEERLGVIAEGTDG